ncbi:hypothetical protein Sango_2771400 [Sesamum angolense]|uniref:CCHC-type domain-containing protein n=1 Tax=Sesamum angolense TaxID=2727404 RepID=A0AAE1T8J6_9LAMI|nr:hypothetical protein Sango_2771400 [Sesamum angolense]
MAIGIPMKLQVNGLPDQQGSVKEAVLLRIKKQDGARPGSVERSTFRQSRHESGLYSFGWNCGVSKIMLDINTEDQLMQFLMGLNEPYDAVRNQILMQEPLPSNMAMQAKGNIFRKLENAAVFQKRKTVAERRAQLCEHCGKNGHTKEVCFEILGYPDCNPIQVSKGAHSVTSNEEHAQNTVDEIGISEIIRNEIQRYMGDAESAITELRTIKNSLDHKIKKVVGIGD